MSKKQSTTRKKKPEPTPAYPNTPQPAVDSADVRTPNNNSDAPGFIGTPGFIGAAPGSPGAPNDKKTLRTLNSKLKVALDNTVQDNTSVKEKHSNEQQAYQQSEKNLKQVEAKSDQLFYELLSHGQNLANLEGEHVKTEYERKRLQNDKEHTELINKDTLKELQQLVAQKNEELSVFQESLNRLVEESNRLDKDLRPLRERLDRCSQNIHARKEEIVQQEVIKLTCEIKSIKLKEKQEIQAERIRAFGGQDAAQYWTRYYSDKVSKEFEEHKENLKKEAEMRIKQYEEDCQAYRLQSAEQLQRERDEVEGFKSKIQKLKEECESKLAEAERIEDERADKRAKVIRCEADLRAEQEEVQSVNVMQTQKVHELQTLKREETNLIDQINQRKLELEQLRGAVREQEERAEEQRKQKEDLKKKLIDELKSLRSQARHMNVDLAPELNSMNNLVQLASKNVYPMDKTPTHRTKRQKIAPADS